MHLTVQESTVSHLGRARTLALVTVAALALGACGAAKTGPTAHQAPTGPLVADGVVALPVLQGLLDRQGAKSSDAQEAELARLDSRLERALWAKSGLEDALGGKAAADVAFAAHGQALTARARQLGAGPVEFTPAVYRADSAKPNIGEGLFGGTLVVTLGADAVVSASNDFKDGEKGSAQLTKEVEVSGSREHVDLTTKTSYESDGVTTTLDAKVGVSPCPDASGRFEATASMNIGATKTGGRTGQRGTLDLKISGQVDDDAKLQSSDADYRMQWADFASSKGSYVDVSGSMGDTRIRHATLDRSGGTPSVSLQSDASAVAALFTLLIKSKVAEAAEKGWQSGRCVILKPTASPGPKNLKASATSTITAAPRSRIDGGPVGGTVTATLSSGGAAVKPAGSKVKADATFTYTAPGEVDKTGTVALEARSRRGVAKATVDLDTKRAGYVASGGSEVKVSGTVPDLSAPFTLQGKGAGFTVTFSYSPSSSTGGTYTYAGAGSGVTMKGSGTYKISGDDPTLTLKQTAHGCVNVGGCRTTTDVITLTRATS